MRMPWMRLTTCRTFFKECVCGKCDNKEEEE